MKIKHLFRLLALAAVLSSLLLNACASSTSVCADSYSDQSTRANHPAAPTLPPPGWLRLNPA